MTLYFYHIICLGGFFGDLPEMFKMNMISWGVVCNQCYITPEMVFGYNGGICSHRKNNKERECLLKKFRSGTTLKHLSSFLAPQTNVSLIFQHSFHIRLQYLFRSQ